MATLESVIAAITAGAKAVVAGAQVVITDAEVVLGDVPAATDIADTVAMFALEWVADNAEQRAQLIAESVSRVARDLVAMKIPVSPDITNAIETYADAAAGLMATVQSAQPVQASDIAGMPE